MLYVLDEPPVAPVGPVEDMPAPAPDQVVPVSPEPAERTNIHFVKCYDLVI